MALDEEPEQGALQIVGDRYHVIPAVGDGERRALRPGAFDMKAD
ncbi:hypothetical protein ACIQCD_10215 [Streptomyces sp. NPDC093250]